MIGPPALCWAMVAAAIGLGTSPNRQHRQTLLWVGVGGILACAAHVKLTALIVSPALVASLFVGRPGKSTLTFLAALWGGFVTVFVVIALSSPSFSFQDLWGSHQQARSEYLQASGQENGFELRWLFQVPALLAAALAGLVVSVRRGFFGVYCVYHLLADDCGLYCILSAAILAVLSVAIIRAIEPAWWGGDGGLAAECPEAATAGRQPKWPFGLRRARSACGCSGLRDGGAVSGIHPTLFHKRPATFTFCTTGFRGLSESSDARVRITDPMVLCKGL